MAEIYNIEVKTASTRLTDDDIESLVYVDDIGAIGLFMMPKQLSIVLW